MHQHHHRRGGLLARLLAPLPRPHHHDSAQRLDQALYTSSLGLRTVTWSFVALALTACVQLLVVVLSGSVALLGDCIHNAADALTAVPLAIAFRLGRRPATRRHTYGLGRAEDLAGAVVVLLIGTSSALAVWQAVHRLLHPHPVGHLWAVALAGMIGFTGNELVARYRIAIGRRIGSAALVADGVHARTDGFTSLAVVLGALGIWLGIEVADPLIGMAIAVMIAFVARDAAREVLRRLMDAVEPATVELAERTAASTPGVFEVDQLRLRWVGHRLRAELTARVRSNLTVEHAHRIAHDIEHELLHKVPRLAEAVVHVEPVEGAMVAHDRVAHHRLGNPRM